MENKLLSLRDIEKDTLIDKTVLKEMFRINNIEPILVGKFQSFSYRFVDIEKIKKEIFQKYEFNKKNRITRHEFISRGGPVGAITKLPMFKTELIDRVYEFKGCRNIYCRSTAESLLALENNHKENESLNLKNSVIYLDMASYKAGLNFLKTSGVKPIPTLDENNIHYLKADIEKLKEAINQKMIENIEKYYTLYDLRSFNLKESEIRQLESIPLQPIDKGKHFKNCSVVYLKSAVDEFIHLQRTKETELILKDQFYRNLGFGSTHKLEVTLNENNIRGEKIGGFIYYKKTDIESLKLKILKKYNYNRANFYSSNELLEKGLSAYQLQFLTPYELKADEKVFDFVQRKVIYKKIEVDDLLKGKIIDSNVQLYSLKEIKEIFPYKCNIKKLLKENNISPTTRNNTGYHWEKSIIDNFIKKITMKVEWLNNNFISISEAEVELNLSKQTIRNYSVKYGLSDMYYDVPQTFKIDKYIGSRLVSKDAVKTLKALLEKDNLERERINTLLAQKREDKQREQIKKAKTKKLNLTKDKVVTFLKGKKNKLFSDYVAEKSDMNVNEIIENLEKYSSFDISGSYFIAKRDLAVHYEIGNLIVNYITENVKYCIYHTTIFFLKSDVLSLLKEREKSKENFFTNYYTNFEFLELGGTSHELRKLQNYEVPREYRTGKYQNTIYVYLKKDCEEFLVARKTDEILESYKNRLKSDLRIDTLFEECLNELNIKFYPEHKNTSESWMKFARKKLLSSKSHINTLMKSFKKFVKITHVLTKGFDDDINKVTTDKVTSVLQDSAILFSYRVEIYIWLKVVYQTYQVKFNYKRLPNLHELNRLNSEDTLRKNPAYTENEFLELLSYVSKVSLHKKRAIEEFELPKDYRRKYYAYESVWLYVMLHLNNGWRSQSFIDTIPRITLPEHLDSYEKYKNTELSMEDAQKIVWELTSKLVNIQHSKNDKKNFFFCSEDLLYPLANALILCELKCRQRQLSTNQLIYLDKNNSLNETLNNSFFKGFSIDGFQFKSLRANHTFIKFSNLIFNQVLKNVMRISKYIRNHKSYDTTNVYIDIDNEQLDKITRQLFNVNYFGYSYSLFKNYLTNKDVYIPNKTTHIHVIEDLKLIFGDVVKIENLAVQINYIEKNHKSLLSYLDTLNSDELVELENLIKLQQLPAKESH